MSIPFNWAGSVASLSESSLGLILVAKWTLLLALAWMAHAALAGRNPRWRVTLWRGAILGIGLIAVLAMVPPVVRWPVAPTTRQGPIERHEEVEASPRVERALLTAVVSSPASPRASTIPVARPNFAARPGPTEKAPPPAATPPQSPSFRDLAPWLTSIWLTGAIILTVRLILAGVALGRLVCRASDASTDTAEECGAIARHIGCNRTVRVVRSAEVATPCLAGLFRPVLILPERAGDGRDDLPAILAHELAHARNHDLAWNLAANLATIALWFHPLAWRLRSAHAAACDAVCDAVAADYLGDVPSYGRTLARLAVRAASPSPAHVLAMARTSDVWRRLDALNRRVFRSPLSWRQASMAFVLGGALLVLIGGLGFTRAEQSASKPDAAQVAKPANPKSPGKLTLRAVAAATNQPIEGVSIEYRGRFEGKDEKRTVATGEDGLATLDYMAGSRIEYFEIIARKAGFVPICIFWDDKRHPVDVPPSKELRFVSGTAIGGILKDQAGRPVAGVKVNVMGPPTESEFVHRSFLLETTETDAQGRWRIGVAPKDLGDVSVHVDSPHYRRIGTMASRGLDVAYVATRGITMTGRIVDGAGRPIKGAKATVGNTWMASSGTTNERGEFAVENCDAGPTIVTALADGFAPELRKVQVAEGAAPLALTLTESGAILRGKVVDLDGMPIAGAFFGVGNWRGHQSQWFYARTGADGRFEWRGAPKDVVLCSAGNYGYMSSRNVPLTASDKEHVITLYPELVIAGRVTEAETGRPVTRIRVVRGQKYAIRKQTDWAENEAVEVTGGRYAVRFNETCEGFFVRIEAAGYEPAESRAFRWDEKTQAFDFVLRRAAELSGVVLLPDGKPAAGAEVVLATETMGWLMQAGHFDRRANLPKTTTGPDGRFAFAPPKGEFLVVAAGDAGYADATPEELSKSGKLVLRSWGKIDGEVRIGNRPGAGQRVTYSPDSGVHGNRTYFLTYGYHAVTDDRGRFAFDRVVPGRGTASRELPARGEGPGMQAWGWQVPVEVKPGQTARVRLGGGGRAVVGRIVLDGQPESPFDWTKSQPVEIHDRPRQRQFAGDPDKDGRFRIEDVPPGAYVLRVIVTAPPAPGSRVGKPIALVQQDVVLAPGRPDQPLVLGPITANLFPTLKVGELAPPFNVERLAGKGKGDRLQLGDERGKLVLIDFWASEPAPSSDEIAARKDIQKTFGGNPRFRLIGLWCDQDIQPARRAIRDNGLIWTHGFAGVSASSVARSYKINAVPATFLIGPDGRILAKDLRGPALKEAIARALDSSNDGKGRRP